MKWSPVVIMVFVCTVAFAQALAQANNNFQVENQLANQQHEPPILGVHWAKDSANFASRGGGGHNSPNMIWHNGPIMTTSSVEAIFWGPSWSNSSFVADKFTGLDSFYAGLSGSGYARTSDEYTGTNGQVTANISSNSHRVDTTTASGGGSTSAILAEVCKVITSPVSSGYYPVYVDLPRGNAGYCAYHSFGTCGSTPIQFAFFWNLDGDPGCDPLDTSGVHSQGLAALANVSGHEISEARTDPSNGGWYDSRGAENGDKCAWTFGTPLLTFSNNSQWKIQGNWSNSAYNSRIGYPNSSGQLGCLDGGNYLAIAP